MLHESERPVVDSLGVLKRLRGGVEMALLVQYFKEQPAVLRFVLIAACKKRRPADNGGIQLGMGSMVRQVLCQCE
jgi:hypothetical protein